MHSQVPMSQSPLWDILEKAYQDFGPNSWIEKGVPYQITSNPFIARHYASMIKALHLSKEPINILEVGAGTGMLAYHLVNELLKQKINFTYHLTDIVQKNLDFWETHPLLKPHINSGHIQTSLYNPLKDSDLELAHPNKPVMIVANYFFDTMPQAIYKTLCGEVYEGHVELRGKEVEQLEIEYTFYPKEGHSIYKEYIAHDLTFLLPIGGFEAIEAFKHLTENEIYILAGDKGYTSIDQFRGDRLPRFDKHGTFSFPVNFEALQRHVEQTGGEGILQTGGHVDFTVNLYKLNNKFTDSERHFVNSLLSIVDPQKMFELVKTFDVKENTAQHYFALLELSNWDCGLLFLGLEHIDREKHKDQLIEAIVKSSDKAFPLTTERGLIYYLLGVTLSEYGEEKLAEPLFEKAQLFGHLPKTFETGMEPQLQTFVHETLPKGHVLQIGLGSPIITAMIHAYDIASHTVIPLSKEEEKKASLISTLKVHRKEEISKLGKFDTILIMEPKLKQSKHPMSEQFSFLEEMSYSDDDVSNFLMELERLKVLEPKFYLQFFTELLEKENITVQQYETAINHFILIGKLTDEQVDNFAWERAHSVENIMQKCSLNHLEKDGRLNRFSI
ncbi:MAG: SAM-dependent methyltransferase [Rhabdochlamydiaceae bacterium]|nr:SAM-dependent methyltransferase [Candidatus Amphrikana amoebophyrae]